MPCRICQPDLCNFNDPRLKSVTHFLSLYPHCAKCKVDVYLYHSYYKLVEEKGREDLRPVLEEVCQRLNGKHVTWSIAHPHKCGGCGTWKK